MPQTFVSPSGTEYEWDKDTDPTPDDIAVMKQTEAKRQAVRLAWATGTPQTRIRMMGEMGGQMLADIGIEGGLSAVGQAAGAAYGGKPGAVVGGVVGGVTGNFIVQKRRITRGEQTSIKPGELLGAAVASAVPTGALAKQGGGKLVSEGAKNIAGNLAGKAVETGVDEGRLPTVNEAGASALGAVAGTGLAKVADRGIGAKAAKAEKDMVSWQQQTFGLAQQLGYKLDAGLSNPSAITYTVDRLAGQSTLQRKLIFENQKITNAIARAEMGFPEGAKINPIVIANQEFKVAAPYREVASISSDAKDTLKTLQRTREEAQGNWKQWRQDGDTKALDNARAADLEAENLETKLEQIATAANKPQLVDELRDARRVLAKIHVVKSALNPGDMNVAAQVIGKIYDAQKRNLTDGLEVIARLENAMPQVMREAAITQAPISSSFRPFLSMALGAQGYKMAGVGGAIAGGAIGAFADIPARAMAKSKTYQQWLGLPKYATDQADLPASLARFVSNSAGRAVTRPNAIKPVNKIETPPTPQVETPAAEEDKPAETPKKTAGTFRNGWLYRDRETGVEKRYVNGEFV